MRLVILVLVLLLVFVTLNYILKCLEYKDLRDLFDNRGNSIKMLNAEVEDRKNRQESADAINRNLNNQLNKACLNMNIQFKEILRLKHKVYVLKKDIKRKDRAIVRYKTQNEVFKHGYHESEKRCEDLRDSYISASNTAKIYKSWFALTAKERSAYLYCLRQVQEEVENAKKE